MPELELRIPLPTSLLQAPTPATTPANKQQQQQQLTDFSPAGHVVLDVGAHIGAYTRFFARAVGAAGRVVAMEPQRLVFQVLASDFSVF